MRLVQQMGALDDRFLSPGILANWTGHTVTLHTSRTRFGGRAESDFTSEPRNPSASVKVMNRVNMDEMRSCFPEHFSIVGQIKVTFIVPFIVFAVP